MDISQIEGFDWDTGNINKNQLKHSVFWEEAEDVFKNKPLIWFDDQKYSQTEQRYVVFGKTSNGRLLVMSITLRKKLIRLISVRDQNKKEKIFYKKYDK